MPVPRRSLAEPLKQAVEIEQTEESAAVAMDAEPNLFAEVEEQETAEDIFDPLGYAEEAASDETDDLPAPAYTPQAEMTETASEFGEDLDSFIAPRAGTPSPEALARLQAAVNNAPSRNAEPQQRVEAQTEEEAAERPRFGINSLINRMTGHSGETEQASVRPMRQQPPVHSTQPQRESQDDTDEQIEIPAFLRRQAN
jgi:cell division protein FtsZ